jgi:hypothetical protein
MQGGGSVGKRLKIQIKDNLNAISPKAAKKLYNFNTGILGSQFSNQIKIKN